jgi:hypothetical protein
MNISRKIAFLSALAFSFLVSLAITPAAQAEPTVLKVYNATGTDVAVWWNCTSPGANNINVISDNHTINVRIPSQYPNGEKGVFTLTAGQLATITPKSGNTIVSGSLTFACTPTCPCGTEGLVPCPQLGGGFYLPERLPNGTNQGEFTLNNNGHESVDISCVNGANAKIVMKLEGGSPIWATHGGVPTSSITNKRIDIAAKRDENCTQVGVYPFNLTQCNSTNTVTCLNGQPLCSATNGADFCELGRNGTGGTVTVEIQGFDF